MKRIAIALMVITACGTSVFAADWKNEGSIDLGYTMPMGNTADVVKGGLGLGLEYDGYKINDMFSIGGAFFYTSGDVKADTSKSVTTWGITPFAKYTKEVDLGGKKAVAYGLFGLGFYNSSSDVSGVDSATDLGFNLGGGLMFPLADKMQLGADLRYHYVATSGDSTNYFVPSVKFTYTF